jgi:hypothetical protein
MKKILIALLLMLVSFKVIAFATGTTELWYGSSKTGAVGNYSLTALGGFNLEPIINLGLGGEISIGQFVDVGNCYFSVAISERVKTIEMDVRWADNSTTNRWVFGFPHGGDGATMSLKLDSGKMYMAQLSDAGSSTAGTSVNSNQWYHVAITSDGSYDRIYIDNDLKYSVASTQNGVEGGTFYIGNYPYVTPQTLGNFWVSNIRLMTTAETNFPTIDSTPEVTRPYTLGIDNGASVTFTAIDGKTYYPLYQYERGVNTYGWYKPYSSYSSFLYQTGVYIWGLVPVDADDSLYNTLGTNMFPYNAIGYKFEVPNGTYTVILKSIYPPDSFWGADVSIEQVSKGTIFHTTPNYIGERKDFTWTGVVVNDGVLDFEYTSTWYQMLTSAIYISETSYGTSTFTPTHTITYTYTPTPTPTDTTTSTFTPTYTVTLTQTNTPTYTATPTITPTPVPIISVPTQEHSLTLRVQAITNDHMVLAIHSERWTSTYILMVNGIPQTLQFPYDPKTHWWYWMIPNTGSNLQLQAKWNAATIYSKTVRPY